MQKTKAAFCVSGPHIDRTPSVIESGHVVAGTGEKTMRLTSKGGARGFEQAPQERANRDGIGA